MRYLDDILKSIRGTSEMIGYVILFFIFFGVDNSGKSGFIELWNNSVSENGVILTLVILGLILWIGYIFKTTVEGD